MCRAISMIKRLTCIISRVDIMMLMLVGLLMGMMNTFLIYAVMGSEYFAFIIIVTMTQSIKKTHLEIGL